MIAAPTRHPSDAVLMDYASGALRPAFAAVAAAHLETCPRCRGEVGVAETVGGALIAGLEPEAMAEDSLAHALARIERPHVEAPRPATSVVDRIGFGPRRWLGPGMWIAKARPPGDDLLYLLHLPAGIRTMAHGHNGVEHTAVLKGAYVAEHGRVAAGDFDETDAEISHQPRVEPDGPCLCLIASERPMRMTNWVGRLVHAMTGV